MKKTTKEWFEAIEVRTIRQQALENMITRATNEQHNSLQQALLSGFEWELTPQGHEYWEDICDKISDNKVTTLQQHIKRVLEDGGTFTFLEEGLTPLQRKEALLLTINDFDNKITSSTNLGYKISKTNG